MDEKVKTSAAMTVMRSRLRSTTVDPAAWAPSPPPNMSDSPPPFPLCSSTRNTSVSAEITCTGAMNQITVARLPVPRACAAVATPPQPAGSGLYVLGTRPVPLAAVDLRRVEMQLTINGEAAATGNGAACLGNPLNSVLWLADAMSRHGTPLRAGECIMTGSLCGMLPLSAGDELSAEIDTVGTVSALL